MIPILLPLTSGASGGAAHAGAVMAAVDLGGLDGATCSASAGLLALSVGLSALFEDDHEMLQHGMVVYDAFYARLVKARDEAPMARAGTPAS